MAKMQQNMAYPKMTAGS